MAFEAEGFRKSDVSSDINVTPMVDVMLVLLIIFMVVTPALLQGFQGELPRGDNLKDREADESRVELGIDLNGDYYLRKKPIRRADAAMLLKREFDMRPQDKVLFVKADRRLKYGELMEAMKIAREAGARVVAAVTEGRGEKEEEK
jgi:biopolymer transport protein ExbD